MKKLHFHQKIDVHHKDYITDMLDESKNKDEFIFSIRTKLESLTIEFYTEVGHILEHVGFSKVQVSREGDVNLRMDAIIVDSKHSIPIEIKSPRESKEINVKAIRQAFENKIILLSRKFYNTTLSTTSLAIAFDYPPERSDIYELSDNIYEAFKINVGIINISDLLSLVYDIKIKGLLLNFEYITTFSGKFKYEKAFYSKD